MFSMPPGLILPAGLGCLEASPEFCFVLKSLLDLV